MGQDNSLEITYDEWRSFFLINPVILESVTNDPHEMLRYWRTASVRETGINVDLFIDSFSFSILI